MPWRAPSGPKPDAIAASQSNPAYRVEKNGMDARDHGPIRFIQDRLALVRQAIAAFGGAQRAYLEAIHASTPASRRQEIDVALRRYCENDTMAMIRAAKALSDTV